MRIILAALSCALVAGCATTARAMLMDRFQAIGLSKELAGCMVDDLDDRLDDEDLRDLARYASGLSRADEPRRAIDSLLKIDNPRAVAAVGGAAFSCVTGFGR
jgi:hypothetical protein